jgi:hypothetical protein
MTTLVAIVRESGFKTISKAGPLGNLPNGYHRLSREDLICTF